MADLPELRSDRLPERPPAPRQLYDRPHTYGVAHDLERMRQGFVPPPRTPWVKARARRRRTGPLGHLRHWWANSDIGPVDLWHRIRCRTGHHDVRGGHHIQLGTQWVFVERRCIWCDAPPPM